MNATPALTVRMRPIAELSAHPTNARVHSEKQVQKRWIRDYYRTRRSAGEQPTPDLSDAPTAVQGE